MDERVWYAVLMDDGNGPPVGLWRDEETAKRVRDKQPPGHKDLVVPLVTAAALAAATERAGAAEGYIAKIEAIRGKKLGVPCCCDFADDDDETVITECNYHRAIREERDAAIARADALAARLEEVDDREHPA